MNKLKQNTAIKKVLADYVEYEENLFQQSLKVRAEIERKRILEQLGSSEKEEPRYLNYLQGINEGIKKMQRLSLKHKEDLENQLAKEEKSDG